MTSHFHRTPIPKLLARHCQALIWVLLLTSSARAAEEKPKPEWTRFLQCVEPSHEVRNVRPGNETGGYTIAFEGGPKWVLIQDEIAMGIVLADDQQVVAELKVGRPPSSSADYPSYARSTLGAVDLFDDQMGLRKRYLAALGEALSYSVSHETRGSMDLVTANAPDLDASPAPILGQTFVSLSATKTYAEFTWKRKPSYRSFAEFEAARRPVLDLVLGCVAKLTGEDVKGRGKQGHAAASGRQAVHAVRTRESPPPNDERANADKERARADAAYRAAEQTLLGALRANDESALARLLRGTSGDEGGQLLENAPCLAMQEATVAMARVAYREARQIRLQRADSSPDYQCSPVTSALQNGRADMLQMLVEEGAPLSDRDMSSVVEPAERPAALPPETRIALFNLLAKAPQAPAYPWAALLAWGIADEALSRALLKHVGGLGGIEDHGVRALRHAVDEATRAPPEQRRVLLSQIKLLIDEGVDVNRKQEGFEAPLVEAACDLDLVDLLLRGRADPNTLDTGGHATPLHRALKCKTPEQRLALTAQLIAAGADVNLPRNQRPNARRPVLADACESDAAPELRRLLKQAGAKVDIPDAQGLTSLMTLYEKTPQGVERLVACGAEVNARDRKGLTPLQHLVSADATDAAKTLCALGAEPKGMCKSLSTRHSAQEAPGDAGNPGKCMQLTYGGAQAAPDRHYKALLSDGRVVEGRSDAHGLTQVCGDDSEGADVSVYSD